MRIVQLIDTLNAGGAERMAVNYANELCAEVAFSALVATRSEGILKSTINQNVTFKCLNRKSVFDLKALFLLKKIIVKNNITLVHAHGTSFFISFLLKLICPKIKIIYHEHFGGRKNQTFIQNILLAFISFFFTAIIVVNYELQAWCLKNLFCRKVYFLPNFLQAEPVENQVTFLNGEQGKRIVFLANLKNPKNHLFVLKAFSNSKLIDLGWSIHLVGKVFNDDYSNNLTKYINSNKLEKSIFLYDVCQDIKHVLSQADIGVLASTDEGFPVTVLEYATAKLGVLVSNVGHCPKIVQHKVSGFVFDPFQIDSLVIYLEKMVHNDKKRISMSEKLSKYCELNFSKDQVIEDLLKIYRNFY